MRCDTYLYAATDHQHVNLGITTDVNAQRTALQARTPEPVRLIGASGPYTHGEARTFETRMQTKFAPCHIHGRWYDLTSGQQDELRERLQADAFIVPRQEAPPHGK